MPLYSVDRCKIVKQNGKYIIQVYTNEFGFINILEKYSINTRLFDSYDECIDYLDNSNNTYILEE